MTAHTALMIDDAWQYPPEDPRPILAQVSDTGTVRLTIYGTDDTMVIPAADWQALVSFVAGHTQTAELPRPSTDALLATVNDPRDDAILARMRELSPDGATMPSASAWNAQRGSLPHSSTLYTRRKWRDWAQLADLRPLGAQDRGHRGAVAKQVAKVEAAAEPPATPFRNGSGHNSGEDA